LNFNLSPRKIFLSNFVIKQAEDLFYVNTILSVERDCATVWGEMFTLKDHILIRNINNVDLARIIKGFKKI